MIRIFVVKLIILVFAKATRRHEESWIYTIAAFLILDLMFLFIIFIFIP